MTVHFICGQCSIVNHYVYKITSGVFYYIGSRSCRCHPDNDRYMGSGVWCLWEKHDPELNDGPRIKTILSIHETRKSAEREEKRILQYCRGEIFCMNRKIGTSGTYRRVDGAWREAVH